MSKRQLPSLYRAFHLPTGKFIPDGCLTLQDRFLVVADLTGTLYPMDGIRIELFVGRFSEAGQPIYQHDRVTFGLKNEFGSMIVKEGVIKYDNKRMAYFLDTPVVEKGIESVGTISILEVIGHDI